eukprot:g33527.t2
MTKVLRKLYGRDQPWMNVLSIGDSTVERAAVMEIMQLEDEVQEAEQAYYELNMLLTTAECKLQRAHWETRCLRKEEGATHSEEFATLSDQYAAEIAKLDEHHGLRVSGLSRQAPFEGFRKRNWQAGLFLSALYSFHGRGGERR